MRVASTIFCVSSSVQLVFGAVDVAVAAETPGDAGTGLFTRPCFLGFGALFVAFLTAPRACSEYERVGRGGGTKAA